MMLTKWRLLKAVCLSLVLSAVACSEPSRDPTSQVLVTSVDHTDVKRQSIGNCWLYAQASWLESLYKSTHGEEINVSESYWTWWHWYDQLVGSSIKEINTAGWWSEANTLVLKYGWVLEEEFIEHEADSEMSFAQAVAEAHINEQLQEGGRLARRADRTPENVRRELDLAFGTNMEEAQAIARRADQTILGRTLTGKNVTLTQLVRGSSATKWTEVSFPKVYGKGAKPSSTQEIQRQSILRRVMKALNDRHPVVMTLMIDFNALDPEDGTFKTSRLKELGPGSQGGHMVVLHDYVVKNVPGIGEIGEGEVSAELKKKALEGQLVRFVAKNSWGKERAERGLTDGYNRFEYDYLTSPLEWKSSSGVGSSHYTTLLNFVLPPGY